MHILWYVFPLHCTCMGCYIGGSRQRTHYVHYSLFQLDRCRGECENTQREVKRKGIDMERQQQDSIAELEKVERGRE